MVKKRECDFCKKAFKNVFLGTVGVMLTTLPVNATDNVKLVILAIGNEGKNQILNEVFKAA